MESARLSELITDAIRYWEPRRLVYNATLALITAFYFWRGYPHSWNVMTVETTLVMFVLAVGANIVYCAAYLPDLFAQYSGFRDTWRRCRWVLFSVGLALAAIITRWYVMTLFEAPQIGSGP